VRLAIARRRNWRDWQLEHSFLSDDFLDVSQESVAIHDRRLRIIEHPFFADHALRIDEKKRSDSRH